ARAAMVATRDARKRRARSKQRRVHLEGSEADRRFAQTLGRAQPAPQGRSVPFRPVDADVLPQSRWQEPAGRPPQNPDAGEGQIARAMGRRAPAQARPPASPRPLSPIAPCPPPPARALTPRAGLLGMIRTASLTSLVAGALLCAASNASQAA